MNQETIVIVANILMLTATIYFAIYISRKSRTAEGWMVAGRTLPWPVAILTQFATASGGGMLVAQVGIGYDYGWGVIIYGLCTGGGVLALLLLARWLRQHEFRSLPDIIKELYGNHRILMTSVTIMAIVVPFGWLCTQLVAFSNLFHTFTGIAPTVLAIVFACISLLFLLPGGMTSVAWTDAVFGGMMLVLTVVASVYAVQSAGGWGEITQAVGPERSGWAGLIAPGLLTIALWSLSILPGTMTNQMYYQRIYAANNLQTVVISLIGTAVLLVATKIYAGLLGMSAYAQNPELGNSEDAAGVMIAGMPIILTVLYSTLICATLLSTVTSAVQSVVVNIVQDVYNNWTTREIREASLLRASRIFSVIVLVAAVTLSQLFPEALAWLVSAYAYAAAGLFCPVFLGFAFRRTKLINHHAAFAGVGAGVTAAGIAHILDTTIPYAAFGLGFSAGAMLLVGWLTSRDSEPRHRLETAEPAREGTR